MSLDFSSKNLPCLNEVLSSLRPHFVNLRRPDKHDNVFDQTNMFTKEAKVALKLGQFFKVGIQITLRSYKKKWQITTFAMIQPKKEDKIFTVDLVVSKDK